MMIASKLSLIQSASQLKRLYWLDYVYTDGNCTKTEVIIDSENSNIEVHMQK